MRSHQAIVVIVLPFIFLTAGLWSTAQVQQPTGTKVSSEPFPMPDVRGLSLADARASLKRMQLTVGEISEISSERKPGEVLAQSIEAGTLVMAGTVVNLSVAEAAAAIVVPDLRGLSESEARALLSRTGLDLGRVIGRSISNRPVVSQSPPAGVPLRKGSPVDITLRAYDLPGLPPPPNDPVEEAWEKLRKGRIAYNPSEEMTQGRPELIRVRITQHSEIVLPEGLKNAVVEEIPVSWAVTAELVEGSKNAFLIQPLSTPRQALAGEYTDWLWRVTPLQSGDLMLILKVTALLDAKDRPIESRDVLVKEASINVHADHAWQLHRFWSETWQYLLASPLVVGTILWIVRRLRSSEKRRPIGF